MVARIAASLIILISITSFPFWVTLILAVCALVYFKRYVEIVPLALIYDSLYMASGARIPFMVTLGSLVVFFLVQYVRTFLFNEPKI